MPSAAGPPDHPPAASPAPERLVIPVFPLSGTLLLPGTFLPLNIFEPRYRNMVRDALAGGRRIGMIQPIVPPVDDFEPLTADPTDPRACQALYPVGCLGQIADCEPQPDGRYLIVLRGVGRFRVGREMALRRGYRRVLADCREFRGDLAEPATPHDPGRLLAAVAAIAARGELDLDLDRLRGLPGVVVLNGLCVSLPLSPAEKQALLEAPGLAQREELLLTLIGLGLTPLGGGAGPVPVIH